jgi:serine/threonine protein kinase
MRRDYAMENKSLTWPQCEGRGELAIGVGTRLGSCQITDRIGEGGRATVYRGRHQGLDTDVAVKVPFNGGGVGRDEILAEARQLARLVHPGIIRVMDAATAPVPHMLMELVDGSDLAARIKRGHFLWAEALPIVGQIADALAQVHRLGMVHRDVKPQNVLVGPDGTVKLIDFGLACAMSPHGSGGAAGTLAYMAPEQGRAAAALDQRADLYSLGVLFFEMVTGRLPFEAASVVEMMNLHELAPVPQPKAFAPELPDAVAGLILRLLSKRPRDRFGSSSELRRAMDPLAA